MKKSLRIFLAALTVLSAAACRTAEQEVPEAARTVRFHAVGTDTRTAFAAPEEGVYRTLWTENDEKVLLSLNYGKACESAVTAAVDGVTATFEAAFDASAAKSPYTFYAVSPASAARAISPSRTAWSVYVAADQTPLPGSVDEAAQLLVAKSAASATLPEEVDLHFAHLTAYGRITLKNLDLGEATVSKVDLVFGAPVVGEWYWAEDGTLTSNGASHTITLHTDASGDLWFACAPVDVSGTTLKVNVYTSEGLLAKEISFPEGRRFASGKVARFSVDMDGIGFEKAGDAFVPVTDASVLRAGDEVLIVNVSGTYALGAQSNGSNPYRQQAAVKVEDGQIADTGRATVLTLEAGSSSGTWAFNTGNGYLASKSSGNALTEVSSKNDYSSWTVSISGSLTTLQAGAGASNLIKYNSSSPRFSCYKASSKNMVDVVLYRKSSGPSGPVADDPLAAESGYGCYLKGAEWTYAKGSDQISRTYTPDGKVEFTLLNAAERK